MLRTDLLRRDRRGVGDPNKAGEMFGKERLRGIIRENCKLSAGDIGEHRRTVLTEFRGGEALDDDLTFVTVKML